MHASSGNKSADLRERLAEFVQRHRMFPVSSRIGVAVSGGADSVFLLHALRELAARWDLKLSVIHVEHGIRGTASQEDAAFVQQLAAALTLPFHVLTASVPAIDENQEQAARRVRQGFFSELIASGTVDRVATGHTRNDQAETVLYRILRGCGLAGLAGILPVTKEGLVRPLLELDRAEIEAWLRERNIAWREDATNQDRAYARNRLRHEILPVLRGIFNPRLDEALSNMAALAQDEEAYWESVLADLPQPEHGPQLLKVSELCSAPAAVARRRVRAAIAQVKGDLRQIDFVHVERILEMARSREGHDRAQLPGLDVSRSFDWIRLVPAGARQEVRQEFCLQLQPHGSLELPGSRTRIVWQVVERPESAQPYATVVDELDWQRLTSVPGIYPELRNWRPGDQYRPVGRARQQKVKFLFQESRIPLWERENWPIITYNGTIVWSRRFGAAAEFAAGPSTRVVLQVQVSAESGYLSHQS